MKHTKTSRALVFALGLAGCLPEGEPTADREARVARPADDQTVTLITGDRVTLRDDRPLITPGPGRAHISFAIRRAGKQVSVIPSDAAPLLGARLDPRLFDVTGLLVAGYSDGKRASIPLIVTGTDSAPGLAASVIVDRALPALHMAIAHQPKGGGAPLASLIALPGAGRIWLDGRRPLLLDRSVPQIGGDVAHARGLTGAGVIVAVLDSGIDANHPDFAGKIAASQDFTGDGRGASDVVGHGTHVASIIAGSGAASGGAFAGVAPGATLVNGRVCDERGCPDSALLAGMAWAALEQHARVINLSVGGSDTPELDPLEQAINTLSADSGALFVVASGNTGTAGSVESPSTADAALSVGAVDRADGLAVFSSEGPRKGDHAIKPELTAPGVGIVAALAGGVPPIGTPVNAFYQALSGTSMATPHVAGAAALLVQQHPAWTGAQIKAQLIASAAPHAGTSTFAQGAGRVDLDRGTRQAVTAEPAVLSLGIASAPHDDDPAITRSVAYHNDGTAPVTLALAASLTGRAGPGVISVAPASLTIPAGGSASAVVTVRTDGALADGLYGGAVVATGGDVRVETPVGVERAAPDFPLTIRFTRHGAPAAALIRLVGPDGAVDERFTVAPFVTALPAGRYSIDITGFGAPTAFIAQPRLDLAGPTTIAVDTDDARPIDVDVGDATVSPLLESALFLDLATNGGAGVISPTGVVSLNLGPDLPPDQLIGFVTSKLGDDPAAPRSVYHLARVERGHLPTGWREDVGARQLTSVEVHTGGTADAVYQKASSPALSDPALGIIEGPPLFGETYFGPFDRVEHFYGQDVVWETQFFDGRLDADGAPFAVGFALDVRAYPPGVQLHEDWNTAPLGPAFTTIRIGDDLGRLRAVPNASRDADALVLLPTVTADTGRPAHGIASFFLDHQRTTLKRDGVVIAEQIDEPGQGIYEVPPARSTYRFERSEDRSPQLYAHSTHVDVAWTFRSQTTPFNVFTPLPLLAMRFAPALDPDGSTAARLLVLPIRFERPAGAGTPFVLDARLEVSFDDGAHYTRVPVAAFGNQGLAVIVHPRGAHAVSLRSSATDLAGNRVEQTIVRAYNVR